jgi:hypothetical protein
LGAKENVVAAEKLLERDASSFALLGNLVTVAERVFTTEKGKRNSH